jgi:hypothetical protein
MTHRSNVRHSHVETEQERKKKEKKEGNEKNEKLERERLSRFFPLFQRKNHSLPCLLLFSLSMVGRLRKGVREGEKIEKKTMKEKRMKLSLRVTRSVSWGILHTSFPERK